MSLPDAVQVFLPIVPGVVCDSQVDATATDRRRGERFVAETVDGHFLEPLRIRLENEGRAALVGLVDGVADQHG